MEGKHPELAAWLSDFPHVVLVRGASMEPSIARGTRVRVVRREKPPHVGDVVLIRSAEDLIVHRVVRSSRFRAGTRIFHVGDAGGPVGLAAEDAVIGRVTAPLGPGADLGLTLGQASAAARSRFARARWRTAVYSAVRCLGESLGFSRCRPARRLEVVLRRAL